ncbi:MAG: hypothetical protein JRI68_15900 [Deltaproteobacteria bacterium]|nr:hypothetical protein [Deltaproteobacteria bacterium]
MAPFAPAEGVLTLRRQGVVSLRRFRMESTSELLEVPIKGAHVPNITAQVDLVGAQIRENEQGDPDGSLPPRPALATGKVELKVPPRDRTLKIDVKPRHRTLEPGGTTTISLGVRDARGAPVQNGKLALVVVDEAVLALTGYELPDPLEVFYAERGEGVSDLEMRLRVALMHPDLARFQLRTRRSRNGGHLAGALAELDVKTVGAMSFDDDDDARPPPQAPPAPTEGAKRPDQPEAKAKGPAKPTTPLSVRVDFRPLAAFVPNVTTDRRGRAEVKVKLPDNLTRYRVMAVGASGERQFGSAESTITARRPLMVRPSPPRFLNYGDEFSLPVVLQNQTSKPLKVDLATRAANARLLDVIGKRVIVPARDRVEVRFRAAAALPGTARFQVGAVSQAGTDASEHEIPVWTPATTEAFATYGQIDSGAVAQRMRPPQDAVPEIGGLELTTSSTALQGLTDAVLYLARYPFECNEQVASRVLAVAGLRDVLSAFQADGLPKPAELVAGVSADIERLRSKQHYSGGWNWWRKDRRPVPYVSIHVAHALVRARAKGFTVPKLMMSRALGYLASLRRRLPSNYPAEVRRTLRAYAVYVLHLAGQPDRAEAARLVREAGGAAKLPLEALGWILPVLSKDAGSQAQVAAIRRHLENRVTETAGAAHFATTYQDGAHLLLHSSRRADAIVLDALIGDQPESDLIPKLVKGLLAHRKRGRWLNTQENAFVLLALDRYFHTYEKTTPAFVARAWLGKQFVGAHRFQGRSTDRQRVEVPMRFLAKQGKASDLVLAKQGTGRLYYRLGMQYAPRSLKLPPVERGFSVSRTYEAIDDPADVRRTADGTWRIKAGALVRVRLSMVAPSRRYHVALVDPLPAGLEPLNSELATTGTLPDDPKGSNPKQPWWWSRPWVEHQNLRDDRVEAFASLVWAGVYDYSYVARATTPGSFVAPPTKAEEMYAPETFGRGASDAVVVE